MTQQNPYLQSHLDKKMTAQEFTTVIAAISEGKYSWACVLILQIAGYNPLHYIPYRTYNRLIKDNARQQKQSRSQSRQERSKNPSHFGDRLQAIEDLEHLEPVHQVPANIRGGSFQRIFSNLRKIAF